MNQDFVDVYMVFLVWKDVAVVNGQLMYINKNRDIFRVSIYDDILPCWWYK